MKKIYISPDMIAVPLHTSDSILTVSRMGEDTAHISVGGDDDGTIGDEGGVWTKENRSPWNDEW